jgi:hypothetical protein
VCCPGGVRLTEDSFRALARSSPWRFSALHFTRRSGEERRGRVEAWLQRPGRLRVRRADGTEEVVTGVPYSTWSFAVGDDGIARTTTCEAPPAGPTYRPDGLVDVRPRDWAFGHADPLFEDYRWVAMLDPAELAEGVTLDDLREEALHGRPVWWARAAAVDGYEPLCGCCPLLWSKASDDLEYGVDRPPTGETHPDAYDVALDVGTGVVVSLRPLGGSRPDDWFDVEIHAVDEEV